MASLRTKLATIAMSICVVAVSGCDSDIFSPGDIRELASARARWAARPFADYSYEIRTFCFCPPEVGQWTRVSVRNGAVSAVEAVDANPQFPITLLNYWNPIDTLFANLDRAMSQSDLGGYYAAIEVDYDVALGYPKFIEYRAKPTVADAGATIEVRNVLPLSGSVNRLTDSYPTSLFQRKKITEMATNATSMPPTLIMTPASW